MELSYNYLTSKMNLLNFEQNQPFPRLVKNNMIFYRFKKLVCGPFNTALITESGDLLLQGMNDTGQLAIGSELGPLVKFFPEFRKIDSLKNVVDVTFGATTCHVLTQATEGSRTKMHAVGENEFGQFGNGTQLQSWDFKEIITVQSFTQISAGAFHMLATDRDGKLYGWGKMG